MLIHQNHCLEHAWQTLAGAVLQGGKGGRLDREAGPDNIERVGDYNRSDSRYASADETADWSQLGARRWLRKLSEH
jgi:hypothetical protein